MLGSISLVNFLLQFTPLETLIHGLENLVGSMINTIFHYFHPGTPGIFGTSKPSNIIQLPSHVKNVTVTDMYKALKPLEGITD